MKISKEVIENSAVSVREKLRISGVPAPDMMYVLDKLCELTNQRFKYVTKLSSDMDDNEAIMDNKTETLYISEAVLEKLKSGEPRARFTIAHELGHYFLGHTGARRRNTDTSIYTGAKERIAETEADLFATYFLAPTELAIEEHGAQNIAMRFQLSLQASEIVNERIAKVRRRREGCKRQSPSVVVDFLKEARRKGYNVRSELPDDD